MVLRLGIALACAVVALVSLSTLPAHAANGGWNKQTAPPPANTLNITGVSFVDQNRGWASGGAAPPTCGSGFLITTRDGGNTWTTEVSGYPASLNAVKFVRDPSTGVLNGWAVGCPTVTSPNGTIVHFVDLNGSLTLTQAQVSTAAAGTNLINLTFVDSANGWAVGTGGTVLHTTDGGITWTPQATGVVTTIQSVSFLNPSVGWLAGSGGVIKTTTDGGTTWVTQTSGTTLSLRGISMTSTTNGWAVGGSGATPIILHWDGSTWTPQTPAAPTGIRYFDVKAVDATHAWAVGENGTIVATSDGINWTQQALNPSAISNQFSRVDFVDVCHGWAVGVTGSIYAFTCPLAVSASNINAQQGVPFSGQLGSAAGGSGPLTLTINWGDGTVQSRSIGDGAITGSHTYAQPGTFTVTLTLKDAAGNTASAQAQAVVSAAPPAPPPSVTPFSGAPAQPGPLGAGLVVALLGLTLSATALRIRRSL